MTLKYHTIFFLLALTAAIHALETSDFQTRVSDSATNGTEFKRQGNEFILKETSEPKYGNNTSSFSLIQNSASPIVNAINQTLAQPVGSQPADFGIAFQICELEQASKLVGINLRVLLNGGLSPNPNIFPHELDLARPPIQSGKQFQLGPDNCPLLRFRVIPAGGKHKIDSLELNFQVRVDTGSTPETLAVSDIRFEKLTAPQLKGKTQAKALFFNTIPSGAMLTAMADLGIEVGDKPDLLFISGNYDDTTTVKACLEALERGAVVFADFRLPGKVRPEFESMLPVNTWSVARGELSRLPSALTAPPFSELKVAGALFHSVPFDLHIPGSPMENSMMRYEPEIYGKPLFNRDWRILLGTDNGIPILISGKSGKGTIYVFGGDFNDFSLVGSPGYQEFCHALLKDAMANRPAPLPDYGNGSQWQIEVPQFQPDELTIRVTNNENSRKTLNLVYEVSGWTEEIFNKKTIPLTLNAGETRLVKLEKRAAYKGDPAVLETTSEIPYLRLRTGFLAEDGKKVEQSSRVNIFTGREINLAVMENSELWPDWVKKAIPENAFDGDIAGITVWPTGSAPELKIRISNRLANIAPLATAADENWRENPTAQGINDLSLSRAGVRQQGKNEGGWAAKPGSGTEQAVSLTWQTPVTAASYKIEGFGTFRQEQRLNPRNFTISSDKVLAEVKDAVFLNNGSDQYTRFNGSFTPETLQRLEMKIHGVDQNARANIYLGNTSCLIKELEILGWPGSQPGAPATGTLEITMIDPLTGKNTVVSTGELTVAPYSANEITVKLPVRNEPGVVRYEVKFKASGKVLAETSRRMFYQESGHESIISKDTIAKFQPGMLCTPGWYNYDSFGRGMLDHTRGWGGPHDKIWALSHGIMEWGPNVSDQPDRMFTTPGRNCHYTNPWRYLPDGSYAWDLTIDKILEQMLAKYPGEKAIHVLTSDRWNGIPIGSMFGWDQFVRFDQYLKANGGEGLKGRSFKAISNEIMNQYGDLFQKWSLEEYAGHQDQTRQKFADHDVAYTIETHGSFPLAGDELGERLGATHLGVGTDLFWELQRQDLYHSIGFRFGLVALNPDLRSGLYKQWGWINSESNRHWYSNNASTEPARRQWYSTYFAGRVDSQGNFRPYHIYGYSQQGGVSTKFYPEEIRDYVSTFYFTSRVRPEKAAGFGMAVSWNSHVNRMRPKAGKMGFGLFSSGEKEDQIDIRAARLYERLVKNGVPVGFVTSSHALKNWTGTNPLLLLDATDWNQEERGTIDTLYNNGAPIIAFSGDHTDAESLAYWTGGAQTVKAGSMEVMVKTNRAGTKMIFCPFKPSYIPADALMPFIDMILGQTVKSTTHMAVNPFISNGALFLAFGNLADYNSIQSITVKPEALDSSITNPVFIDFDSGELLKTVADANGGRRFELPVPAASGRMIMISNAK